MHRNVLESTKCNSRKSASHTAPPCTLREEFVLAAALSRSEWLFSTVLPLIATDAHSLIGHNPLLLLLLLGGRRFNWLFVRESFPLPIIRRMSRMVSEKYIAVPVGELSGSVNWNISHIGLWLRRFGIPIT